MPLQRDNERAFSALWFGGLSLILLLPLSTARFSSIVDWSAPHAVFAVCLEGLVPFVMAALSGYSLAPRVCSAEPALSSFHAFMAGVKISLCAAAGWVIVGIASVLVGRVFLDTSRFAGGVLVMAIFGLPIYGTLAGFGAIVLKSVIHGRAAAKGRGALGDER